MPTQPTIQYAVRGTSAGVQQKGQKVDHWAPSSAQLYLYSPLYFHIVDSVSIIFTFSEMLNILYIKGDI